VEEDVVAVVDDDDVLVVVSVVVVVDYDYDYDDVVIVNAVGDVVQADVAEFGNL
jgi:hypothetical protein